MKTAPTRTRGRARSSAPSTEDYIAGLPEDRRPTIRALRTFFQRNVPKGYRESVLFGVIAWAIPLERFPDTYNGQPLCYAAIASQKNHYALYLMCAYGDAAKRKELEAGFRKAGKKLDMGKACLRFRSLDDLPLDVIGETLAGVTPEEYIDIYERSRARTAPAAKKRKAKAIRKS